MTPPLKHHSPSTWKLFSASEGVQPGTHIVSRFVFLCREFLPALSLPCSGLTQELTLSYDPRGAHFSMALFLRRACGLGQLSQVMFSLIGQEWPVIWLITATPHQVMATQRGTGLCLTCSTWLRAQSLVGRGWGAAVPAGRGCSGVSQRTATHFSSLSGIRREPSHLERVGLLTTQPVCQTSVSLAIKRL